MSYFVSTLPPFYLLFLHYPQKFASFVLNFLLLKFYFMNKISLRINVDKEERDSFSDNVDTSDSVYNYYNNNFDGNYSDL